MIGGPMTDAERKVLTEAADFIAAANAHAPDQAARLVADLRRLADPDTRRPLEAGELTALLAGRVVPTDAELTHEDQGLAVYVPVDLEGDHSPCGAYLSLARACAYILDWLRDGDLPTPDKEPRPTGCGWEFNGYQIEKTILRV